MFKVDPKLFEIVHRFIGVDESRPYFTGVLMTQRECGLVLVATDSKRMIIGNDPEGYIEPDQGKPKDAIVKVQKEFISALKKQDAFTADFPHDVIEADFPDWEKVIPVEIDNKTDERKLNFNSITLTEFAKVQQNLDKKQPMSIHCRGVNEPTIIFFSDKRLFGVQMPIIDETLDGYPFEFRSES
jgi:DNA polymerase III sliding clamp (beta) subunit (PCNA family)